MIVIPMLVQTPTGPPPPTVLQTFFRQVHLELINAIQAGRADEAAGFAALLVFVGNELQPKPPRPQVVGPTWKAWRRAWSNSSR